MLPSDTVEAKSIKAFLSDKWEVYYQRELLGNEHIYYLDYKIKLDATAQDKYRFLADSVIDAVKETFIYQQLVNENSELKKEIEELKKYKIHYDLSTAIPQEKGKSE